MNREARGARARSARPVPRGRRTGAGRRGGGSSGRGLEVRQARVLSIFLLLLCLVGLGAAVSGVFTVRTVRVVGAGLPQATIVAATDVTGKNIFRVRADQVVERLSHIPSIDVDRVEVSFPDEVTVYARSRQAVLAWATRSGDFLMDRAGTQIGEVRSTNLPLVSGGSTPPDAGTVAAVEYALTVLPPAPNGAISGFQLDDRQGLLINGQAGWQAILGRGSPQLMVKRVATLAAVLRAKETRGRQLTYINLRYGQPFYKVAGSP